MTVTEWARSMLGRPFVWGETDCGSLVRQALELRGRTVEAPAYSSLAGARRCFETTGGVEGIMRALGAMCLPAKYAAPGDMVVVPGDGFPCALVNIDGRYLEAHETEGVRWCPGVPIDGVAWRLHG